MCFFFENVRNTSFTCTINIVSRQYLFFIFFKVTKNNFIVFKFHVYTTVQQHSSNTHQLVKIAIVIKPGACFILHSLYIYIYIYIYPIFTSMR